MTGCILHAQDFRFWAALRQRSVIRKIEARKLLREEGIIVLMCGDADQSIDILMHLMRLIEECGFTRPRVHIISVNGGAIRLIADSPTNEKTPNFATDLMAEIRGAAVLKQIHHLVMIGHAPCGMARNANMMPLEYVEELMLAKQLVKEQAPEIHSVLVTAQLSLMDGDIHRRETRHFSREAYLGARHDLITEYGEGSRRLVLDTALPEIVLQAPSEEEGNAGGRKLRKIGSG